MLWFFYDALFYKFYGNTLILTQMVGCWSRAFLPEESLKTGSVSARNISSLALKQLELNRNHHTAEKKTHL